MSDRQKVINIFKRINHDLDEIELLLGNDIRMASIKLTEFKDYIEDLNKSLSKIKSPRCNSVSGILIPYIREMSAFALTANRGCISEFKIRASVFDSRYYTDLAMTGLNYDKSLQ